MPPEKEDINRCEERRETWRERKDELALVQHSTPAIQSALRGRHFHVAGKIRLHISLTIKLNYDVSVILPHPQNLSWHLLADTAKRVTRERSNTIDHRDRAGFSLGPCVS